MFFSCSRLEYKITIKLTDPETMILNIMAEKDIKKRWEIAGGYFQSLNQFNYPIIKDNQVYFFYWDEKGKSPINFVSGINDWNPKENPLQRVGGTPLLYIKLPFSYDNSFKYLFSSKGKLILDSKNSDVSSRYFGRDVSVFDPIRIKYPAWLWKDRNNVGGKLSFSSFSLKRKKKIPLLRYSHKLSRCESVVFIIAEFNRSEIEILENLFSNLYSKYNFPAVNVVLLGFSAMQKKDAIATINSLSFLGLMPLCALGNKPNKKIKKILVIDGEMAGKILKLSVRKKLEFDSIYLFNPLLPRKQRRFRYLLRRATAKSLFPGFTFVLHGKQDNISYAISKMKEKSVTVEVKEYPKIDLKFRYFSILKVQLEQVFMGLQKQ